MTFDEEVTHVICYCCECHPITVRDVHDSLHAAGYNTSLLVNSLTWPSSNSIPIVQEALDAYYASYSNTEGDDKRRC